MERIENILKEVCKTVGVGLYDWEIINASKGKIFVVYITKLGGVTVNECKEVSKKLTNILDDEVFISGNYFIEVSSPGLERGLRKKSHFVSAINEKIIVTYSENEKIRTDTGVLKEVLPDTITLEVEDKLMKIDLSRLKKAKTFFDYKTNGVKK